jgi:hypothetical protein
MRQSLIAVTVVLLASTGALGAPSTRVRVDRKGVLHLSAAQLKALGVGPSKEGYLGVQFPRAPRPAVPPAKGGHGHAHGTADLPATVWAPVRRDRSVSVSKTRIGPNEYLPGPPGTLYVATAGKGKVMLQPVPKQGKSRSE